MAQLIPVLLALLFVVHLMLFLAGFIRFSKWSESAEIDLILGIPFFIVLFGTAGAILTVGMNGIFSWIGPAVLLFFIRIGKVKCNDALFHFRWHLAGFLLAIIFFLLKFFVLYDPASGTFFCTFHDDYSYISQINLLHSQARESHFSELVRLAFHMDHQYKIYHLIEFYFILLFKAFFGGNAFQWFHFFLKPFLNVMAILMVTAFISERYPKHKGNFCFVLLCSALFYTTLRFNLADDFLNQVLHLDFLKSVFFQNYYFPAPLSYHVSYKISLAFIFLIPVFFLWIRNKRDIMSLICTSSLAVVTSIAFVPFCGLLFLLSLCSLYISDRKSNTGVWILILIVLSLVVFKSAYDGKQDILKFIFGTFFRNFNLIFENYYWQFFYFSLFILLFIRTGRWQKFGSVLLLIFPLVFVFPSLLFKIYSAAIIFLVLFFTTRKSGFIHNDFIKILVPLFILLYFSASLFPLIPNLAQVHSNIMFLLVSLVLLEYIFQSRIRIWPLSILFPCLLLLVFNVPAIAYDNRTPLHKEQIPEGFFTEPVWKNRSVNILSISEYPSAPFLDQFQLGQGIYNRMDNAVISMAGFELLDSGSIDIIRETGFISSLKRIPAWQELYDQNTSLADFIVKRRIKVVLIEKNIRFAHYLMELSPMTKNRYYEPNRGYYLLVLK
jgi:hypothetical protein